ncbi:MAG: class I SAM-dependent methyltransferase [Phycisphaerales bacterium]|nr:class I SAM-dependent methyltransferase [Phycisphaerales bacterium]
MAPFLAAVHGGRPTILREDFCGSGGVCRAWTRLGPRHRAIAVDLDARPLRSLRRSARVTVRRADVLRARDKADVISATNFPIGYWHTRRDLIRYLRHARACLRPAGVFVCDTYGGATAFTLGSVTRDHRLPDGRRIRYTWEQRRADPLTGMVLDILHFRVDRGGDVLQDVPEAFTYHWRLWSVPELRDAMDEAGFARTDVYSELADAVDSDGATYVRPVTDPAELEPSFILCIAARG